MRLDHIAYRTNDRKAAAEFFMNFLDYKISEDLPEGFDIHFEDGTKADCLVMLPKKSALKNSVMFFGTKVKETYHKPPEIFISDGSDSSIVAEWVKKNQGPGIHHVAYEVESVRATMKEWKSKGIKFTSEEPLTCPGLVQVFTEPNLLTGMVYELIEREAQGFCQENVKDLMESTK